MRASHARRLVVTAVVVAMTIASSEAHASSALELVRIAHAHEAAREEDIALRRYMEALSLDPTCDEAYLGLGSLRTRRGDLREAERVYSVALEHLPDLRAARTARAYVRRALGWREDAARDLIEGASDHVAGLRAIATWQGEDGQIPAQLATWRQVLARAEALQDQTLMREARTMVRALVIIVGPADPAAAPADERGARKAIAGVARRGG